MSNKEPIKKKLIYFKSKENFENALKEGRIKESSIVFIGNLENNRETLIYTHGRYFGHTSSEIRDLIRLVISDSKEISIGEDYGNGIEISYPEEIEWERINSDSSFNSEIDSVQSAILKLDKNISTLANEVIKDSIVLA